MAGGFIAQYSTWRWGLYATSIADGVLQLVSLFFLHETYSPILLERQAAKLRKETSNDEWHSPAVFSRSAENSFGALQKALVVAWARPFQLLAFQPTIQVMSLFMAYSYGLMYLFLSSFAQLWQTKYGLQPHISGLNYFALAIGMVVGAQLAIVGQAKVCVSAHCHR